MKRKSVGKNTLLLSLRMLFLLFINLYASRITLDYLGVVDFGVYNLVAGIIVTMGFINNSMALSANRFLNYSLGKGSLDETRNVFNMSLNLHVLANSTSKCKITKCFCKSTPLVLRNSISFLVSH